MISTLSFTLQLSLSLSPFFSLNSRKKKKKKKKKIEIGEKNKLIGLRDGEYEQRFEAVAISESHTGADAYGGSPKQRWESDRQRARPLLPSPYRPYSPRRQWDPAPKSQSRLSL